MKASTKFKLITFTIGIILSIYYNLPLFMCFIIGMLCIIIGRKYEIDLMAYNIVSKEVDRIMKKVKEDYMKKDKEE